MQGEQVIAPVLQSIGHPATKQHWCQLTLCCSPREGVADSKKRKAVDWFAPKSSLQAAAGRAACEYRRDAERHLQEALNLQPGAVDVAFALIQVCLCCRRTAMTYI